MRLTRPTLWLLSCLLPILGCLQSAAAVLVATHSIRDCIAAAAPGDTILVPGPGVYHERLRLAKTLRLIGTHNPVIDGGGTGCTVVVTAPKVELRGLTLVHSGKDLNALDSTIMLNEAPGVVVAGCDVRSEGFGIYLRAASGCVVQDNLVTGNPSLPPAARGNGIHLWKTSTNAIVGNRIRGTRDGVYLSFADHTLLAGNVVEDTRFGIHYMYSHYNQLLTNTLSGNAVGATLMFSQWSLIQGNIARGNRRHGMVFKQLDNSQVLDNRVYGQNRGFFVQQASLNRFEGNVIATNDIGLYLSNGSEQNVFVRNAFIGNVDQVWQPPYEAELGRRAPNVFYENHTGNFWSDYTGADANGDGIGDSPYYETDVFGYLLERYPEARVFALSPALAAIRKAEQLLPVLDTKGVTDLFPLVSARLVGSGALHARR